MGTPPPVAEPTELFAGEEAPQAAEAPGFPPSFCPAPPPAQLQYSAREEDDVTAHSDQQTWDKADDGEISLCLFESDPNNMYASNDACSDGRSVLDAAESMRHQYVRNSYGFSSATIGGNELHMPVPLDGSVIESRSHDVPADSIDGSWSSPQSSSATDLDVPESSKGLTSYDACFSVGESVENDMAVIIYPDLITCDDTLFLESHIIFSPDSIEIECSDSDAALNGGNKSIIWGVLQIIRIESVCSEFLGSSVMKLVIRVDPENESDLINVQIVVTDIQWQEEKHRILNLSMRYQEIWNVPLDSLAEDLSKIEPGLYFPKHYFTSHLEPFEDVIYPKGDPDAVSISRRDVDLLLPDTFVNDTIIDFYIKYLKLQLFDKEKFHFFNSFFFRKLIDLDKETGKEHVGRVAFLRVRKWTRRVNLFKKDYVFIPINFNLHWSLIVICHPGEIVNFKDGDIKESSSIPCILHMDSLKGSHVGLKSIIQSYLLEEWKERHPESTEDYSDIFLNLRFISLELPQQENAYDCGLFLLHFVERFLEDAPAIFNPLDISDFSSFLSANWFPPAEASFKRAVIRKLIFDILNESNKQVAACANTRDAAQTSLTLHSYREHVDSAFVCYGATERSSNFIGNNEVTEIKQSVASICVDELNTISMHLEKTSDAETPATLDIGNTCKHGLQITVGEEESFLPRHGGSELCLSSSEQISNSEALNNVGHLETALTLQQGSKKDVSVETLGINNEASCHMHTGQNCDTTESCTAMSVEISLAQNIVNLVECTDMEDDGLVSLSMNIDSDSRLPNSIPPLMPIEATVVSGGSCPSSYNGSVDLDACEVKQSSSMSFAEGGPCRFPPGDHPLEAEIIVERDKDGTISPGGHSVEEDILTEKYEGSGIKSPGGHSVEAEVFIEKDDGDVKFRPAGNEICEPDNCPSISSAYEVNSGDASAEIDTCIMPDDERAQNSEASNLDGFTNDFISDIPRPSGATEILSRDDCDMNCIASDTSNHAETQRHYNELQNEDAGFFEEEPEKLKSTDDFASSEGESAGSLPLDCKDGPHSREMQNIIVGEAGCPGTEAENLLSSDPCSLDKGEMAGSPSLDSKGDQCCTAFHNVIGEGFFCPRVDAEKLNSNDDSALDKGEMAGSLSHDNKVNIVVEDPDCPGAEAVKLNSSDDLSQDKGEMAGLLTVDCKVDDQPGNKLLDVAVEHACCPEAEAEKVTCSDDCAVDKGELPGLQNVDAEKLNSNNDCALDGGEITPPLPHDCTADQKIASGDKKRDEADSSNGDQTTACGDKKRGAATSDVTFVGDNPGDGRILLQYKRRRLAAALQRD